MRNHFLKNVKLTFFREDDCSCSKFRQGNAGEWAALISSDGTVWFDREYAGKGAAQTGNMQGNGQP